MSQEWTLTLPAADRATNWEPRLKHFSEAPCDARLGDRGVTKHGTAFAVHNPRMYSENSEKGTVVLIHGIGDWSFRFASLVKSLNKAGFQVVTYDMLGRGYSPTAANRSQTSPSNRDNGGDGAFIMPPLNPGSLQEQLPGSPWSMRWHIAEFKEVLSEAIGRFSLEFQRSKLTTPTPVHVVGHSMGGCLATYFAALAASSSAVPITHRSFLSSCVLLAPAGAMTPGPLGCGACGYSFLQCCCGSLCGCCFVPCVGKITNGKYKAKGFISDGHAGGVGGLGGADPNNLPVNVDEGPELVAWDVQWVMASRHVNGNRATVASAARMPLMDVKKACEKDPAISLQTVKAANLPVLVLQGADDLVVKTIRKEMYVEMFGRNNVTFETRPGGHNFFIQDNDNVAARLEAFFMAVGNGTTGSPAVVGDFCR